MSEKLIPEHVDPFRYAEQSLGMAGIVKIQQMQRLSANVAPSGGLVVPDDGVVSVDLQFGVDEQKVNYLKGRLETKLTLQCQRCMEPYIYEIMSDFALGIVTTLEEADALPELYEPVLSKEGSLALRELIEDELILNLPIIPRHDVEDCSVKPPYADAVTEVVEGETRKGANPFQVLESLKQKHR